MMESLYYTGIMHAFRTATEPGTRDTLNGHWFQNYAHSLAVCGAGATAIALWPVCGPFHRRSVFGYILRQNDRDTELCNGETAGLLHQRTAINGIQRRVAYAMENRTSERGFLRERDVACVAGFVTLRTPPRWSSNDDREDVADRYLIMGLKTELATGR